MCFYLNLDLFSNVSGPTVIPLRKCLELTMSTETNQSTGNWASNLWNMQIKCKTDFSWFSYIHILSSLAYFSWGWHTNLLNTLFSMPSLLEAWSHSQIPSVCSTNDSVWLQVILYSFVLQDLAPALTISGNLLEIDTLIPQS